MNVEAIDLLGPEPGGPGDVTEQIELPIGWPPIDLCAQVLDRGSGERHMSCRVSTPHLDGYERGKVGEWRLAKSARALVDTAMDEFTAPGQSERGRIASLVGAGKDLFDAAPEAFRTAFWRLLEVGAPLETILVASQELSVPWELMVPTHEDGTPLSEPELPLGARYSMARWYETKLAPARLSPLADARVVAPDHESKPPLAHAQEELDLVIDRFGGARVDPALVGSIDEELGSWGGTLLHFVCHGETATSMSQVLLLDRTERFTSSQVRGMPGLLKSVRESRPVVFINACEAGRETLALIGSGGFAKRFIDAGARAVVAPLWSVEDEDAFAVATRFYDAVTVRPATPFAEILREIRATAYTTGKDSFAAYCLYGDPLLAAEG